MSRPTRRIAVVVLALAASMALAAPAPAITRPHVFSVLEVPGPDTEIDPGSNEIPRVGQRFGFASTLYAWAGTKRGKRVGGLEGFCTWLRVNVAAEAGTVHCHAEWRLPGGRILGAGFLRFSASSGPSFVVPVIGGTGVYHNAKGFVRIRSIGASNRSVDEFHLTP
ncbi:MAG: hypothetical protein AVDCRST_MAG79-3037 [uncultured Thermoleophilia bacterium]|uniref:Uncharacterized protein n=1 Tax=uncultured Thermoleophilia bacterium TaxID=1497501 RepID=A0A6J4UQG2_9ACTN|nr:MAG: hypothetical protein AVDCRST_MAG79-3037 [uncultured Thermoleophilia bacterium]